MDKEADMTYWDMIVKEITNKHRSTATFCFTHRNNSTNDRNYGKSANKKNKNKKKKNLHKYLLGDKYPHVAFTHQEAQCMKQAIRGKTIPKIAASLKLSPRTVEFYFGKMRRKMSCHTKSELIEKVIESDFLKNVRLVK